MKARIAPGLLKSELFIALLIFFISIIGYNANAQGWTFTFSVAQSGLCTSGVPPLPIPSLPNFAIPTQSQCESIRQTLLAIKSSIPMYDNSGNYIGDCSAYVTCTPCTGSDIVVSGQVSPGDVSFDGQFEGQAFFSTHESSAFEDWSKDYRQQLESYGITSILGNTLNASHIPLTGDREFDAFYNNQTANFNPKTSPVNVPVSLDANVVDLSGKKGVVQLLTTQDEQAKRDKWYADHIKDQGYNNLLQIKSQEGIDPNASPSWDENSPIYKSVDKMIDKVGENPNGVLAAYIGKIELSIGKNVFSYLDGAKDALKSGTEEEFSNNNPNPAETAVMGMVKDQATSKINEVKADFTKGAQGTIENAGGKVMTYMYGEKGGSDFKTALNVISYATKVNDQINNVTNWLAPNSNGNH
ncbi:MAG: hypothetical protein Q7U54_09965 [Bacteroidales bacterium]|nr:hypothetical protein [Bacteroidales bacterium]